MCVLQLTLTLPASESDYGCPAGRWRTRVTSWPLVDNQRWSSGNLKKLTSFFVRAKHWQVFVLVWGAYFVGAAGIIEHPSGIPPYSAALILVSVFSLAGWLWGMGSFLFSIAPPALRLNIHFFHFAIIFAAVTVPTITALPSGRKPSVLDGVLLLLFLFALFCWAYTYYFVAKSLVGVESARAVTRRDYIGTVSLLWIGFIGVWEIQPRINRLYAANRLKNNGRRQVIDK